tara:strand:+ start:948 stop:1574 length:627 start_codon:yes stop_codon:yes gene_type:complete
MKNIKLTESDLINLIEKLVKENFGASNGNGQNLGIMGTPTAKYKEIFEKEDIEEDYEEEDHEDRDEFDGRDGEVVGVDSDIDKQRMGESKKRTLSLSEGELINLIEKVVKERKSTKVIKEQNQGGAMTPEQFEKMLGASKRYNKYHDNIEGLIKNNYDGLVAMAAHLDKVFNNIGAIFGGLHKGKKVGAQFIKNTLMAFGLASMVGKK